LGYQKKHLRIRIYGTPDVMTQLRRDPELMKQLLHQLNQSENKRYNFTRISNHKLPLLSQLLTVMDIIGRWVL
jgi:hypothetical protein